MAVRAKAIWLVALLCSGFGGVCAQDPAARWADSVMQTLTTDQKIAQLFLIPVSARSMDAERPNFVDRWRPGGLLITGGSENQVGSMITRLQERSQVPMLVAINAEWGPGQVLDSSMVIPPPMLLTAANSDSLAFLAGRRVGRRLRRIGINMNFAVNADTDVPGPESSIAGRYYSNDAATLVRTAGAWMRGLQREKILAVIRHIPGETELEKLDVYKAGLEPVQDQTGSFRPLRDLMAMGSDGMLTSWLHYTIQVRNRELAVAISDDFIPEVIRSRLNHQGLMIAEAAFVRQFINSKGKDAVRKSFEQGHDLILIEENFPDAIRQIKKIVKKNDRNRQELDLRVRRILLAKYKAGLTQKNTGIGIDAVMEDLISQSIREYSVTVVQDKWRRLPVVRLDERRFVHLNFTTNSDIGEGLLNYVKAEKRSIRNWRDTAAIGVLHKEDVVIAEISDRNHLEISVVAGWLNQLDQRCQLIVVHMGNPRALRPLLSCSSIVEGYDHGETAAIIPQVIFGALPSRGQMPVRSPDFPAISVVTKSLGRLAAGIPEQAGMSGIMLQAIDDIVAEAIQAAATPGGRVVVARRGRVVVDRSYGWQAYDRKERVTGSTLYDLASVTKVAATLQTTMFLHQQGMIDVNKKASVYLPELRLTNKQDFTLKDILTHQAGLWPFLPFWTRTMKDSVLLPEYYSREYSADYPYPVADGLFARATIRDSLWRWILDARISEKKDRVPYGYKYSDMAFYMLQHLAEKMLNQPMEDFLEQNLYGPIGAWTVGYLPLRKFSTNIIAPTENDTGFRKSLLRGYVHDQGAALHGGVAGHAGLFSTGLDLAKLGQMWLQEGYYGGHRYFRPETIRAFTERQYLTSRRGLGWDKPLPGDPAGPTSVLASPQTFGHTGFTGTCIWVDPVQEMVFVFLSNRVHPDMNNTRLLDANIRPRIHDVLYRSIKAFDQENHSLF